MTETRSRRHAVPFDPEYYGRRAARGEVVTPLDAFRHAYATNHWAGATSPSGPGADGEQTRLVRQYLPALCQRLGIRRLLDLPCGDGSWMAAVDLGPVGYVGADLLPELIESNRQRYHHLGREFLMLDLLAGPLPDADLLLCRDCLVHFSFADIDRAIATLQSTPISYLVTTTFPDQLDNEDIHTGDWRPVNFERRPFNWPPPEELFNEGCTEGQGRFRDKSLGLWRVDRLPPRPPAR